AEGVRQAGRLPCDRGRDGGVRMPRGAHAEAGREVDVHVAIGIADGGAAAGVPEDGRVRGDAGDVTGFGGGEARGEGARARAGDGGTERGQLVAEERRRPVLHGRLRQSRRVARIAANVPSATPAIAAPPRTTARCRRSGSRMSRIASWAGSPATTVSGGRSASLPAAADSTYSELPHEAHVACPVLRAERFSKCSSPPQRE